MRRALFVLPVSVSLFLLIIAGCQVCQTDDDCDACETCVGRAACVLLDIGVCCETDADCNDGNLCTEDSCVGDQCSNHLVECPVDQSCDPETGECVNEPPPVCVFDQQCDFDAECDDGEYCTGIERCVKDCCQDGSNPCGPNETCNEAANRCDPILCDCDDNNACTSDSCVNAVCSHESIICNDENLCTSDSCNATTGCVFTPSVDCLVGLCNPQTGSCEPCDSLAGNLIVNGRFETGDDPGEDWIWVAECRDDVAQGWLLCNVDYVGTSRQAAEGTRSLDLSGCGVGSASQSIATVAGEDYTVRFAMAGNAFAGPDIKALRLKAAGQSQEYTFDITGHTIEEMGWVYHVWSFVAQEFKTLVEFESLTDTCDGPMIDDVSVSSQASGCETDTDCNDGLFCNGDETCQDGCCTSIGSPCTIGSCDETANLCVPASTECTDDADCSDDGVICNGGEFCHDGSCASSGFPCRQDSTCDENTATCTGWCNDCDSAGFICSGYTLSAMIDDAVDVEQWTLCSGDKGQRVILQAVSESVRPCIRLYAPGNLNPEVDTCCFGCDLNQSDYEIDHQLEVTGQYVIQVADSHWAGVATGGFVLGFINLSGAQTSPQDDDGGPLPAEQTRSSRIDDVVDADAYTIIGHAGQSVRIRAVSPDGSVRPCIRLYPPSGRQVEADTCCFGCDLNQTDYEVNHQLQETGQYLIYVSDSHSTISATGNYAIWWELLP